MEIILNEDIDKLGYKNDIVDVKPGYARNYLIPQGMAKVANEPNKKMLRENLRQASHKTEKIKQDAENLSRQLEATNVSVTTKVGTSGKIFGSVNTQHIAKALKEKGFDIDRKKIKLNEDIKYLGTYTAEVDLHKEVKATINVTVEGEQQEA